MNKELLKLLEQINSKKAEVKNLVSEGKIDEAEASKAELVEMQRKFDILKDMTDEEPVNMGQVVPVKTESFANMIRHLPTNLLKEGTDANGGYTVPEDVQTKINHYKETHRSMRDFVEVENVTTDKGSRVYELTTNVNGFSKVNEDGSVQAMGEPRFEQVTYAIEDYAGYLPVTNDLLADTDANLEGVIVDWVGRNSLKTDNNILFALAEGDEAPTAITDIDDIKKIVISDIGSAYDSKIITNDNGLLFLDTLKDEMGRYLLNPNPTEPAKLQLRCGAKTVPVEVFPNADLANVTIEGENDDPDTEYIPFIIGDTKAAFKLFDRQQTKIYASKDAVVFDGQGAVAFNAFQQRGQIYRADVREQAKLIDENAFVFAGLAVGE